MSEKSSPESKNYPKIKGGSYTSLSTTHKKKSETLLQLIVYIWFDMSNPLSYYTRVINSIVSNYEVNKIIHTYLTLWYKHPELDYVHRREIEICFLPEHRAIVSRFFIDEHVNCDEFVIFVCFFLFYNNEDILNVLISMIGVNSFLFITKDQVNDFFLIYGIDKSLYKDLDHTLSLSKSTLPNYPKEAYNLKAFEGYLLNNISFLNFLKMFKNDICSETFVLDCLTIVNKRIEYYNRKISEDNDHTQPLSIIQLPIEPCLSKSYRILFTVRKPPYHYDFIVQYSPDMARKNVLSHIKQKFGVPKKRSTRFKLPTSKSSSLHGQRRTVRGLSLKQRPTNEFSSGHDRLSPAHVYSGNSTNRIYPCSFYC